MAPMSRDTVIRSVVYSVLAIAVAGGLFEWSARRQADAAWTLLQNRDLEQVGTSPADVQRLLGRPPDAPGKKDKGEFVETYSWQGVRKHTVSVLYSPFLGEHGKEEWTMESATVAKK